MDRGFTVRSDSGGDELMRGWWYDTRWFGGVTGVRDWRL